MEKANMDQESSTQSGNVCVVGMSRKGPGKAGSSKTCGIGDGEVFCPFCRTKYRLGWWFKGKYLSFLVLLESISDDPIPTEVIIGDTIKSINHIGWTPHSVSFLKMNVDGAMSCDGIPRSIGGLLRDHSGKKLL
ncbi:hypothetical protein V6N12_011697 [Hibiscus sabdariffa]|uniref:Uncharacterized protein n=1 Tax=Hibiscus sabdariffa TaxID=183260 RepID=A0ABR2B6G2_9ROSI